MSLVDQLSFSFFFDGLFLHLYVLVQNSTVQPTGSKRNLTLNYFQFSARPFIIETNIVITTRILRLDQS